MPINPRNGGLRCGGRRGGQYLACPTGGAEEAHGLAAVDNTTPISVGEAECLGNLRGVRDARGERRRVPSERHGRLRRRRTSCRRRREREERGRRKLTTTRLFVKRWVVKLGLGSIGFAPQQHTTTAVKSAGCGGRWALGSPAVERPWRVRSSCAPLERRARAFDLEPVVTGEGWKIPIPGFQESTRIRPNPIGPNPETPSQQFEGPHSQANNTGP